MRATFALRARDTGASTGGVRLVRCPFGVSNLNEQQRYVSHQ